MSVPFDDGLCTKQHKLHGIKGTTDDAGIPSPNAKSTLHINNYYTRCYSQRTNMRHDRDRLVDKL